MEPTRGLRDANRVPLLAALSNDGFNTVVTLEADPATGRLLVQSSGGGGGGAATIADGADVTEGAIADVAVVGDNAGTVSAKLRGINKALAGTLATSISQTTPGTTNAVSLAQVGATTTVTAGVNGLLAVGGNAASLASDTGNPVKIGGVYNTSNPAPTNGQRVDLQMDVNGFLRNTLATLIAGEDITNNVLRVEQHGTYAHVAAGQATTTVKSGAGFLYSITFNGAATATNVTTIYDNTAGSGTVIAIPAATTATIPTTIMYNVAFNTGLTIVTATANGSDMTVSYR